MKSDFVQYDKMSKKAQREHLRQHRKPPIPPKKIYDDVHKYKVERRKG